MSHKETPVIIPVTGREGGGLAGMLYEPAGERAAGSVVCCPRLFEERKAAHRVDVELARALCDGGWLVLRFDYSSCGDSPGALDDGDPRAWVSDIEAALAFAGSLPGGGRRCLLGMRFGAALAMCAASRRRGVDTLVAVAPVWDGDRYLDSALRRKLVNQMATLGRGRDTRRSLRRVIEQGGTVDLDGYPLTGRIYRGCLDLDVNAAVRRYAGDVRVVTVSPAASGGEHGRNIIETAGGRVTTAHVNLPPFWNLVGRVDATALTEAVRDAMGAGV